MKKSFILSVLVFSIITLFGQNTFRTSEEIKVDLIHNKVDLNFNQAERAVIGTVSLTFKPHFYGTDHVVLDAKDSTSFKILKVTFESKSGTKNLIPKKDYFFEDLEHLKIKLGRSFLKDEILKLTINYEARPYSRELPKGITDRGCFFINHDGKLDGVPKQIWTQGETEWNSCWMPIIDAPNQRYSQEFSLTVEDEYVTQSNGELVKSVKNMDDTRTDIWQLDKTHTPYLTAFVVGEFAVIKDYYKDIELKFLVEKEFEQEAANIFGKTKEMMAFFEEYFGVPYPWGKSYGQVVIRGFSSTGMENTGCVTYDDRVQVTKTEALDKNHGFEYVIAHELAHMWFGDLLTCEDWSQLALNESFATLAEYLWFEHKYGKLEADQYYFDVLRQYYFDERDVHEFPAIRYNYPIPDKMFNSLVYEKGANILQMLRKMIGEDAFKASIKFYLQENQFSAVEIDELRMAFEEVSGKDLKPFFNYFTSSGHPTGNIHFEFDEKKVKINFDSMTNVPISGLEGTLRIYFEDGNIIDQKQIIYGDGMFFFEYSGNPIGATFEPEGMQLRACSKIL